MHNDCLAAVVFTHLHADYWAVSSPQEVMHIFAVLMTHTICMGQGGHPPV